MITLVHLIAREAEIGERGGGGVQLSFFALFLNSQFSRCLSDNKTCCSTVN